MGQRDGWVAGRHPWICGFDLLRAFLTPVGEKILSLSWFFFFQERKESIKNAVRRERRGGGDWGNGKSWHSAQKAAQPISRPLWEKEGELDSGLNQSQEGWESIENWLSSFPKELLQRDNLHLKWPQCSWALPGLPRPGSCLLSVGNGACNVESQKRGG